MRKNYILFALPLLIIACSPSKKAATKAESSAVATTAKADNSGNDGSSFEKAIIVESVAAEYAWLRANYPGYKMISQSLTFKDKKPYDILNFKTSEGEEKKAYFDISKFFGKF